MREILFRGRAKANYRDDGGYWIYGGLVQNDVFVLMDDEHGILFEVAPETVGQYTGMRDKGNNKIFEGDVVRFDRVNDDGNESHEDFLIIFAKGAFRAQCLDNLKKRPKTLDKIGIDKGYVVGFKRDNSEPLEIEK